MTCWRPRSVSSPSFPNPCCTGWCRARSTSRGRRSASRPYSQSGTSLDGWISSAHSPRSLTSSRRLSRSSSSPSAARLRCPRPNHSARWSSSVQPPSPLAKLLEAALFAASRPLTLEELASLEPEAGEAAIHSALAELRAAYDMEHGVELVEIAEGWQFLTRREYAETIERAQFALRPRRLSPAALETLAIIAYRQPVGRLEVDEIRGVDSGAVMDKLVERGLIEVVTRGEGLGRPLLYGTTPSFLEILGLKDLEDLPRLEELSVALRRPTPVDESE